MIASTRTCICGLGSLLLLLGGAARAGAEAVPVKNRAPVITGSSPHEYFTFEPTEIRWGKEVRFQVNARDPDEDKLDITAELGPDVAGAGFDSAENLFRWTPSQAQRGSHDLRFTVSDGSLSQTRVVHLTVVDNRPPEFRGQTSFHGNSGEAFRIDFSVVDPDGDVPSYEVSGLPRGARFEGEKRSYVEWKPSEDQIGVHTMRVSGSDGTATVTRDLEIFVEDEWNSSFLPGLYYSLWSPTDRANIGTFQGVGMEIVPYAWIHRNANRGPSHGRITLRADVLDSSRAGMGLALIYSAGLDLSIERNPYRRWLIPFFGVDGGGLLQKQAGHHLQVSPHLGCYLWTSRNLFVSMAGSYVIVPGQLDSLSGWRASAGLNLTLW